MELLYFILSTFGICAAIAIINYRYWKTDHEFLHCPFCLGYWVGAVVFLLSPFTNLLSFDISIVNGILLPFVSAGSTYILGNAIGDNGIRITKTKHDK